MFIQGYLTRDPLSLPQGLKLYHAYTVSICNRMIGIFGHDFSGSALGVIAVYAFNPFIVAIDHEHHPIWRTARGAFRPCNKAFFDHVDAPVCQPL